MHFTLAREIIAWARIQNALSRKFSKEDIKMVMDAVNFLESVHYVNSRMTEEQDKRRKYKSILNGASRPYEAI